MLSPKSKYFYTIMIPSVTWNRGCWLYCVKTVQPTSRCFPVQSVSSFAFSRCEIFPAHMAWVKSQQGSESRGPGSKQTAQPTHRRQELTLALDWLLCGAPLQHVHCRKKMSFLVSCMSVWACPGQCIMGFVPERGRWTGLMLQGRSINVAPSRHSLHWEGV